MLAPPIRWLTARKRSAEKLRSANWLLKNMPTNDAIANAFRIQACSQAVKPRPGRYPKISGSQAPQMKNSRNIITDSFQRTPFMGGTQGEGERGGMVGRPAATAGTVCDRLGF